MKQSLYGSQPDDPAQRRSKRVSMLLGLSPMLLWVAASVLVLIEGRCQPHTRSSLLALLAVLLWGGEVVGGLLGLFVSRRHALAKTLLFTLLFSLPLGLIIAWVIFLETFCLHLTF